MLRCVKLCLSLRGMLEHLALKAVVSVEKE